MNISGQVLITIKPKAFRFDTKFTTDSVGTDPKGGKKHPIILEALHTEDCLHNPHLLFLHELGHLFRWEEVADVVGYGRIIVGLLITLVPSAACCSFNLCLAQLVLPGSLRSRSNDMQRRRGWQCT